MAIASFRRPDGTVVLWNTTKYGEGDTPLSLPPSTSTTTSTTIPTALSDSADQINAARDLMEARWKQPATHDEKKLLHQTARAIAKGDMSEEDQFHAVQTLIDSSLIDINDRGDVTSKVPIPKGHLQPMLNAVGNWRDIQDDIVQSFDQSPEGESPPPNISKQDFDNAVRDGLQRRAAREERSSATQENPSMTVDQWRSNMEDYLNQAMEDITVGGSR